MRVLSTDLFSTMLSAKSADTEVTVTINPEPSDATVTLICEDYEQEGNSITVPVGSVVSISVTKSGYVSYPTEGYESLLVIGQMPPKRIPLQQKSRHTITIVPTPATATVGFGAPVEAQLEKSGLTATAFDGSTITYSVAYDSMNTKTGSVVVSEDKEIAVVLDVTLTLTSTPSDAVKNWNGNKGAVVTVPCNTTATWSVSKPGYVTQTDTMPESGQQYLLNTEKQVTLVPSTFTFTVNTNLNDAIVTIKVNNGEPSQEYKNNTVECHTGDTIVWSVNRQGYTPDIAGDTFTVGTTNPETVSVNFALNEYNVRVSASVNEATVQIKKQGVIVASGTGYAYTTGSDGDVFECSASYAGASKTESYTVDGQDISQTLYLDPATDVELITDSVTKYVQPGRYKAVLVGGGGPGGYGAFSRLSSRGMPAAGGSGGSGGCSGYITIGEFVTSGENISFEVGAGGRPGSDGSASRIYGEELGEVLVAEGGKQGKISVLAFRGAIDASVNDTLTGGSGCGASGTGGFNTSTRVESKDGGDGAYGGGNGKASFTSTRPGLVPAMIYYGLGGVGYYGVEKFYENNHGTAGNSSTHFGNPGKHGRSLSALRTILTLRTSFLSVTLQELYNSLGAGGGGGAAYTPDSSITSLTGNWYGGPGGGGSGWEEGEDGINNASIVNEPGKGGDGAILLCRVDWE